MKNQSPYYSLGLYGAVGFQLAAAIAIGALGGQYLDKKLNTQPWLLLIGVVLGSAIGFLQLYKLMQSQSKEEEGDDNDDQSNNNS